MKKFKIISLYLGAQISLHKWGLTKSLRTTDKVYFKINFARVYLLYDLKVHLCFVMDKPFSLVWVTAVAVFVCLYEQ